MKIYVTGMGIISSLGIGVEESLKSILGKKSMVKPVEFMGDFYKNKYVAGQVPFESYELHEMLAFDKDKSYSRSSLLATIAFKEAIESAQIKENGEYDRIAIIGSTMVALNTETENKISFSDFSNCDYIYHHDGADVSKTVADFLGIKKNVIALDTACSSSSTAIALGTRMIEKGIIDCAIVGGSDELSKFTFRGFDSLQLLDHEVCKPFDQNRKGINLGEGAGFLVLESEKRIKASNSKSDIEISGIGNACDAYNTTASSPTGIGLQLSMKGALDKAGLETVDFIKAHGTGTTNNDLAEGMAMQTLFNGKVPPFSSAKAMTGHCLAAASVIESIISIICLDEQIMPANLNFSTPIDEHLPTPITENIKNVSFNNIMVNTLGMGGSCSSLIFSKNRS